MSDTDILILLKAGSKHAFEELYNRYSGKIYRFVLKITNGNAWLSEELVQRTFIKVWEKRAQLDLDKSVLSWMCTIAKNMMLNELEHQTVEYVYREYFLQNAEYADCAVDKAVEASMLETFIDELTERLPPARKKIFLLSRKEGFSVKEISEYLNLAPTTIQTQLTKALEFIKKHLSKRIE